MKNFEGQDSKERVEKLTQALKQLDIAKSYVEAVLKDELQDLQPNEVKSTPPSLWQGYPHKIGDRVRIVNPNFGQSRYGFIVGRTGRGENGFITVAPDNNKKNINRVPKNLIIQNE